MEKKKILLVAYKIESGKGSEDGSGYNIVLGLIRQGHSLTLISRRNNVERLRSDPAFANTTLVGIDVPRWLGFFKKGGRGIVLYYYLWQIFVGLKARALQRDQSFDVVHQLNFHTDWAPHFLRNPHGKLVWGPMSHHKRVPSDFIHAHKAKTVAGEWIKVAVKNFFWRLDPCLRFAIRRSDVILYADRDLAPPFRANRKKVVFQSYASSIDVLKSEPGRSGQFDVLMSGRLVPLKGFNAAVAAFIGFARELDAGAARMTIVGSGELAEPLRRQVAEAGMESAVRFVPWVAQNELKNFYGQAAVFLYPSFEAQGLVVAEAMGAGVPVICLQDTGPSFLAENSGLIVPRSEYRDTVRQLKEKLEIVFKAFQEDASFGAYLRMAQAARKEYDERLDWSVVVRNLSRIYET